MSLAGQWRCEKVNATGLQLAAELLRLLVWWLLLRGLCGRCELGLLVLRSSTHLGLEEDLQWLSSSPLVGQFYRMLLSFFGGQD